MVGHYHFHLSVTLPWNPLGQTVLCQIVCSPTNESAFSKQDSAWVSRINQDSVHLCPRPFHKQTQATIMKPFLAKLTHGNMCSVWVFSPPRFKFSSQLRVSLLLEAGVLGVGLRTVDGLFKDTDITMYSFCFSHMAKWMEKHWGCRNVAQTKQIIFCKQFMSVSMKPATGKDFNSFHLSPCNF